MKQTKLNTILKNPRVIILLIFLFLSLVSLQIYVFNEGVAIRTVAKNSASYLAGIHSSSSSQPMAKELIVSINNKKIKNVNDYYNFIKNTYVNQTLVIKTVQHKMCFVIACLSNSFHTYTVKVLPDYKIVNLNETETRVVVEPLFNETLNKTVNITKTLVVNKTKKIFLGPQDIGLSVYNAPVNNLKKGLDLEGGTRVLLKLEEVVDQSEMDLIIDNIKERLNVYGLSDIVVRQVKGFGATQYILVEVAGINKEEIKELIAKQGKFEAKIGNEVVFKGGKDITYVARAGEQAGIEYGSCGKTSEGTYACRFRFAISLSPEAAKRQAEITKNLKVVFEQGQQYLNESLSLYLDDELVDTLRIGADLKGNPVTEISISGSGTGVTEQDAASDAIKNMKKLQTVLITGSLPVKLDIVKTDSISPTLGKKFVNNVILITILSILGVTLVVLFRYKNFKISIPMVITMLSEVFILLGFAALVGWNLDIAAVAGIIIAVGTGVDDQIVISDETLNKKERELLSWKQRFKKAFFIILASYATTMVAMFPLYFAGAGLVKGFALTTMAGVTIGVLITRPAFAKIIEILIKD